MVSSGRTSYRFPRKGGGWLGENNREGQTDEIYQAGALWRLRNYHLVGRGRAQKREGYQSYSEATPSGVADAIQGLRMFQFGSTRKLFAFAGGKIATQNGSGWDDRTNGLTLSGGKDNRIRTSQFRDGYGSYLIGNAPGNNYLWKCDGSSGATLLSGSTEKGPRYAADITEFHGRPWVINTDSGETITEYAELGSLSEWGSNYFHCSRESPGVGLSRHGRETLLAFHQRSIHSINYDYGTSEPFVVQPVSEHIGAICAAGIVHSKGVTYFPWNDGFYRIKTPKSGPQYIGWPMEDDWNTLNRNRLLYIEGFERGEPWNEVAWLVSDGGQTEHKKVYVWNTELEAWSIFESLGGHMAFNAGCNFTDSNGKDVTIVGDYDGNVYEAWGDEENSTGYRDGGEDGGTVRSELTTGLLDLGYDGIKRLREVWLELVSQEEKTFTLEVITQGESVITQGTGNVGAGGDRLSVDFFFGTSRLASGEKTTFAKIKEGISTRGRLFQFRLTENDVGKPHVMNAIQPWFVPRGKRFNI